MAYPKPTPTVYNGNQVRKASAKDYGIARDELVENLLNMKPIDCNDAKREQDSVEPLSAISFYLSHTRITSHGLGMRVTPNLIVRNLDHPALREALAVSWAYAEGAATWKSLAVQGYYLDVVHARGAAFYRTDSLYTRGYVVTVPIHDNMKLVGNWVFGVDLERKFRTIVSLWNPATTKAVTIEALNRARVKPYVQPSLRADGQRFANHIRGSLSLIVNASRK